MGLQMKIKYYDILIFLVVAAVLLTAARYSKSFVPTGFARSKFVSSVIEPRDSMYGITAAGEKGIWIVGNNGKIVRSNDGGMTWANQDSGTQEHLLGVAAWDENRAVAVGNGGVVVVTKDGGKTWKAPEVPRSEVANKLFKAKAHGNGTAWAVGVMSMVVSTEDWGDTWTRRIKEEDVAWNDIAFAGIEVGIVVGEFGRIKRTNDDGNTWEEIKSPVESSLMAVEARDRDNWVIVGLEGVILRSTDSGKSWVRVTEGGTKEHLFSIIRFEDGWVTVGDLGCYVSGNDNADQWEASSLSPTELLWHTDMAKLDSKLFIVGGTQGIYENGEWSILKCNDLVCELAPESEDKKKGFFPFLP
jgi:photosystem II stability/assembly factor-like uncharacterized protein